MFTQQMPNKSTIDHDTSSSSSSLVGAKTVVGLPVPLVSSAFTDLFITIAGQSVLRIGARSIRGLDLYDGHVIKLYELTTVPADQLIITYINIKYLTGCPEHLKHMSSGIQEICQKPPGLMKSNHD